MSQTSQGGSASKEELAWAFLEEEDLDIADEDNVKVLLSVGFRTKPRFLRSIRMSGAADRLAMLDMLKAGLGMSDYIIFHSYLKGLGLEV
jgi:hypothetical protein